MTATISSPVLHECERCGELFSENEGDNAPEPYATLCYTCIDSLSEEKDTRTLSERYPGEMLPVRVIRLSQGQVAIVDPERYAKAIDTDPAHHHRDDVVMVGKWCAEYKTNKKLYAAYYAKRNIRLASGRSTTESLHQVVTDYKWKTVDHANHDGLSNTCGNLRDGTGPLNNYNRNMTSDNSSGYIGVTRVGDHGRNIWRAQISRNVNGRKEHTAIRCYENPRMAALARDLIAWHRYGDYAVTNFPRESVAALWNALQAERAETEGIAS